MDLTGQLIAELTKALGEMVPPLQGVTTAFSKLGQLLLDVGEKITGTFLTAMKKLGEAFIAITQPLSFLLKPFQDLSEAMLSLGSKALSPLASIVDGIGSALAPIASKVTGALGPIAGAIGSYLGKAAGAVGSALGAMGSALGEIAGGAGAALGGLLGLGQAMAGLVGKANPGALQLFQNIVDDLLGVIGQALTPILQVVGSLIRIAADSLASWLPALGQVVAIVLGSLTPAFQVLYSIFGKIGQTFALIAQAAAPGLQAIGAAIGAIFAAIEPVITLMAQLIGGALAQVMTWLSDAVKFVTPYIIAFANVLKSVFEWVSNAVKELLALVGITLPELTEPKKGASVGAAAKGTSIGSVESLVSKAKQAAYAGGTDVSPAVKMVSIAGDLKTKAEEIEKRLRELPQELWDKLPPWIQKAIEALVKAIADLAHVGSLRPTSGPGIGGTRIGTGSETADAGVNAIIGLTDFLAHRRRAAPSGGAVR